MKAIHIFTFKKVFTFSTTIYCKYIYDIISKKMYFILVHQKNGWGAKIRCFWSFYGYLWVTEFYKSRFSTCCISWLLCHVLSCSCYSSVWHHSTTSAGYWAQSAGTSNTHWGSSDSWVPQLSCRAAQTVLIASSPSPDSGRLREGYLNGFSSFKNCLYQPQTTSNPQQPHTCYPHRSEQTQTHHPTKWKQLLAKLFHLLQYFIKEKKKPLQHTQLLNVC